MQVLTLNTSTGRQELVTITSLPANSLQTEVWNNTGATIPKGSVVYISGSHGNLPTIALSQANSETNSSKTYGLTITNITNQNNGFVCHSGLLENLDTFGVPEGVSLWLSPTVAGGYTTTKPSAPNHMVFVGVCTRAHPTFGTIEVTIQNGFELQELHNVAINESLTDNDILRFNSANNLWENNPDLTTLENTILDNNAMGARIIPNSGASMTIGANYESIVTRRMFIYGRLILKGRVSIIF
jgi:hypothetical protein